MNKPKGKNWKPVVSNLGTFYVRIVKARDKK